MKEIKNVKEHVAVTLALRKRIESLEQSNKELRDKVRALKKEFADHKVETVEELRFIKSQMMLLSRENHDSRGNSAYNSTCNTGYNSRRDSREFNYNDEEALAEVTRQLSEDGLSPRRRKLSSRKNSSRSRRRGDNEYLDMQYDMRPCGTSAPDKPSFIPCEDNDSLKRRKSSRNGRGGHDDMLSSKPSSKSTPKPIPRVSPRSAPVSTVNSLTGHGDHPYTTERVKDFFADAEHLNQRGTVVINNAPEFTAHHFRNTQMQGDDMSDNTTTNSSARYSRGTEDEIPTHLKHKHSFFQLPSI